MSSMHVSLIAHDKKYGESNIREKREPAILLARANCQEKDRDPITRGTGYSDVPSVRCDLWSYNY